MKILAIYKFKPGFGIKDIEPLMFREEIYAFKKHLSGDLREIYETDAVPGGTVCILEAKDVETVKKSYADLPLMQAGFLDLELFPLTPFSRWSVLFTDEAKLELKKNK